MAGAGTKLFVDGNILTAAEVNTYLQDQVIMRFANAATRDAAFGGVGEPTLAEGMFCYLNDVDQMQVYNGSAWIVFGTSATNAYAYVQTIYYTTSSTFTKATYPWLRAIKIRCQGGGGGGAGAGDNNSAGGGGGGGGYGERFVLATSLGASETVTIGAAGTGGAVGNNSGASGGTSSFGSLLVCTGGGAGLPPTGAGSEAAGGTCTSTNDFSRNGDVGYARLFSGGYTIYGTIPGGDSFMGNGGRILPYNPGTGHGGRPASGFGGGGGGAWRVNTSVAGGNGTAGLIIVDLFA